MRGRLHFLPHKEALALGAEGASVQEPITEAELCGAPVQCRVGKRPVDLVRVRARARARARARGRARGRARARGRGRGRTSG